MSIARCYVCFKCNQEITKEDQNTVFCYGCYLYVHCNTWNYNKNCEVNTDTLFKTKEELNVCTVCEMDFTLGNRLYNERNNFSIHVCHWCQLQWELQPYADDWFRDKDGIIWCTLYTSCEFVFDSNKIY